MLYADTSAVLPYYRQEAATDAVERMLRAQTTPVLISDLTPVEVACALARWVRMGELSETQANRVESAFFEDVRAGRFARVALDRGCFERAYHWLLTRRTAIRTLDALHLAAAQANGATLATLDNVLLEDAERLGVDAIRPA